MSFRKRIWSLVEDEWLRSRIGTISINQMTIALARNAKAIKIHIQELVEGKTVIAEIPEREKQTVLPTHQGRRKDLGDLFVRSGWEADVLRYLSYPQRGKRKVTAWKYEERAFWFEGIERGNNRHYLPDVEVTFSNSLEPYYIEVKGHLRPGDRVKLKRFKKFYPKEFERLIVVVGSEKTEACKFFKKLGVKEIWYMRDLTSKYKNVIPNWESH